MISETSHEALLMQALGFASDDLAANRAGQLSEMQHYLFRVKRRRSIAIGALIVLVCVFIASLLVFMGGREDGSAILTLIGIGVTICSAAIMGVFARYWMRLTVDIQNKSVQAYSGKLERVIKPVNRRVMNYMIRVDGAETFVSKEAFETFDHLIDYTIYRAPSTGTLLSAERLDS
jgi:hypothetical protein